MAIETTDMYMYISLPVSSLDEQFPFYCCDTRKQWSIFPPVRAALSHFKTSYNKVEVQDHTISRWFIQDPNLGPALSEAYVLSSTQNERVQARAVLRVLSGPIHLVVPSSQQKESLPIPPQVHFKCFHTEFKLKLLIPITAF